MGTMFRRLFEAHPAAPSLLRRSFRAWLRKVHWPGDHAEDLVMAVNEAVTNAVEHAYPPVDPDEDLDQDSGQGQDRMVRVLAELGTDPGGQRRVIIEVRDSGSWRPVPTDPGYRGCGLRMIRRCTGTLDIAPTPSGTRVTMTSRPIPPRRLIPVRHTLA